jgi:small subunit ribosomal protein S21
LSLRTGAFLGKQPWTGKASSDIDADQIEVRMTRLVVFFTVETVQIRGIRVQVLVRDNNVDQALRALKKKMQREGIFREMKLRGHYEKPSEKKAREKAEAVRRARKLIRKRMQREGLLPSKPRPTR